MKPNILFFIFLLVSVSFSDGAFGQGTAYQLVLTKVSNNKSKVIEPDSYFKLKTRSGEKVKGRFASFTPDALITTDNDTIRFDDLLWLTAREVLTNTGKGFAITGVFLGGYLSFGSVPAAFFFLAMHSNPYVFLAAGATVTSFILGFNALKGRKHKMKRWRVEAREIN